MISKHVSTPCILKSLINEQGGYVLFLVLSKYSFIRVFRLAYLSLKSTTVIMLLKTHVNGVHGGPETLKMCPIPTCGKGYGQQQHLWRHIKSSLISEVIFILMPIQFNSILFSFFFFSKSLSSIFSL